MMNKVKASRLYALAEGARQFAEAPISGFLVGAAGVQDSGTSVFLGTNVEFPGGSLGDTVHAEQFVIANVQTCAENSGAIAALAVTALPCGHCRQFLMEMCGPDLLLILKSGGEDLEQVKLGELLPKPVAINLHPKPSSLHERLPSELEEYREALSRCRTGATGAEALVVLKTETSSFAGHCIEVAAFNPTLGPFQAALVNLLADAKGFRKRDLFDESVKNDGKPIAKVARVLLIQSKGTLKLVDYSQAIESLMKRHQIILENATLEKMAF